MAPQKARESASALADIGLWRPSAPSRRVAALALLCVIVLSSLRVVRRVCYEGFWVVHVVGYVGFFVTVCYHTVYAAPWIFPPLAFYGLDVMLRLGRFRIKDASLTAVDQNMTIVRILLYHLLLSRVSRFPFPIY